MNMNHETLNPIDLNDDMRTEYVEPTLVRHGTISDLTHSNVDTGSDGGTTSPYTASV